MHSKVKIGIGIFMSTVLFVTMLIQSIHFTEHLGTDFWNKEYTIIKNNSDNSYWISDTTHHHCFVCEFTLATVVFPEIFNPIFNSSFKKSLYILGTDQTLGYLLKNSFGLRAPPCIDY